MGKFFENFVKVPIKQNERYLPVAFLSCFGKKGTKEPP